MTSHPRFHWLMAALFIGLSLIDWLATGRLL